MRTISCLLLLAGFATVSAGSVKPPSAQMTRLARPRVDVRYFKRGEDFRTEINPGFCMGLGVCAECGGLAVEGSSPFFFWRLPLVRLFDEPSLDYDRKRFSDATHIIIKNLGASPAVYQRMVARIIKAARDSRKKVVLYVEVD